MSRNLISFKLLVSIVVHIFLVQGFTSIFELGSDFYLALERGGQQKKVAAPATRIHIVQNHCDKACGK
jgi:hypothetical protein